MTHRAGSPDGGAVVVAVIFTALETPAEGYFRRLPETAHFFGDADESKAEELAQSEVRKYYDFDEQVLGKGTFRKVRKGVCVHGEHKGQPIAISETMEGVHQELGVKRFRNSLVMDRRRLLNWLFLPKSHVVKVMEIILTPKSYFYVMELLEGRSLMATIDMETLSMPKKYDILRQICVAIGQVHSARLIHRDIKPDNFRFSSDGTLKLIDVCGMLCTVWETNEREVDGAVVCGTLAYMSPEALVGMGRQAADMWAVGVILHLMLVKSFPFEVTTIEDAKVDVQKALSFTDGPWKEVPEDMIAVLEGLLDRNARNRFTYNQALELLPSIVRQITPDADLRRDADLPGGWQMMQEYEYFRDNSAAWKSAINWHKEPDASMSTRRRSSSLTMSRPSER